MRYNPTLATNIGLVTFFITLFIDKAFNVCNANIINIGYIAGAILVLIGTIGYFVRKT